MVGRVRRNSVELQAHGQPQAPEATPCPQGVAARSRPAHPRTAPLGPDRSRHGRVRRLLRVRLLPRLGGRRGGGGAGRRDPLHVRRRGLRVAGAAVRRRRDDRGPADGAGAASAEDRRGVPHMRADARPRGGLARARPRRHAPRRLPRPVLPEAPRRPGGRVALLDLGQAVLHRRLAHPVRLPAARRHPAAHRRVRGEHPHGHARGGRHDHRAHAPHRNGRHGADPVRAAPADRPAGARGPRAGRARDPRGDAGAGDRGVRGVRRGVPRDGVRPPSQRRLRTRSRIRGVRPLRRWSPSRQTASSRPWATSARR